MKTRVTTRTRAKKEALYNNIQYLPSSLSESTEFFEAENSLSESAPPEYLRGRGYGLKVAYDKVLIRIDDRGMNSDEASYYLHGFIESLAQSFYLSSISSRRITQGSRVELSKTVEIENEETGLKYRVIVRVPVLNHCIEDRFRKVSLVLLNVDHWLIKEMVLFLKEFNKKALLSSVELSVNFLPRVGVDAEELRAFLLYEIGIKWNRGYSVKTRETGDTIYLSRHRVLKLYKRKRGRADRSRVYLRLELTYRGSTLKKRKLFTLEDLLLLEAREVFSTLKIRDEDFRSVLYDRLRRKKFADLYFDKGDLIQRAA